MLLASVMTVPVRPGAVVTAGNELHFTGHVRWSFKKLGSVFVFLKKIIEVVYVQEAYPSC